MSRGDDRSQSSVIGIVLIIGITLTVAVATVAIGGSVIGNSQQDSRIAQAEQSMAQFDSKASQVALGDATRQEVSLGNTGGSYQVDPDAGSVTIVHEEWEDGAEPETIYEGSLGAVIYRSDDTEVAYQGGGVWRSDPEGAARMVSPPEFHYQGATLTFPVITVRGSGMVSGDTRAKVSRTGPSQPLFPNGSASYGESGPPYANPVENGTMKAEIQSEYCEGWRLYFQQRTEGDVSSCEDDTVTASLETLGDRGDIDVIGGSELNLRGVENVTEFEITFTEEGSGDGSGFSNFEWSMHGESDDGELLEFYLTAPQGTTSCGDSIRAVVYYSPDGGETFESWTDEESFEIDCDDDTESVTVDFLGDVEMTYEEADEFTGGGQGQALPAYRGEENQFVEDAPDLENDEIGTVVKHYLDDIGSIDLDIEEGNQAGIGDASGGVIDYEGGGHIITYLHITENEIEIEFR